LLGFTPERGLEVGEYKSLDFSEISRLVELITEVSHRGDCSPSEAIDNISRLALPRSTDADLCEEVLASFVSRLRKLRMRRNELFGAPLFRDPAWDMLLDLYVAHHRKENLTVTSLCYGAGVPISTGTRHLQRLENHGLVVREEDECDMRRTIAKPTAKAISGMQKIAHMLLEDWKAFATAVLPLE
jgi:hypothetical protein